MPIWLFGFCLSCAHQLNSVFNICLLKLLIDAPVVRVVPSTFVVAEYQNVFMECLYDSNPSSLKQVTWYVLYAWHALAEKSNASHFIFYAFVSQRLQFWRKKDGQPVVIEKDRMEGSNTDLVGLKIQQVLRSDMGNYTCELQNDYGSGESQEAIGLDVHCKFALISLAHSHKVNVPCAKLHLIRADAAYSADIEKQKIVAAKWPIDTNIYVLDLWRMPESLFSCSMYDCSIINIPSIVSIIS